MIAEQRLLLLLVNNTLVAAAGPAFLRCQVHPPNSESITACCSASCSPVRTPLQSCPQQGAPSTTGARPHAPGAAERHGVQQAQQHAALVGHVLHRHLPGRQQAAERVPQCHELLPREAVTWCTVLACVHAVEVAVAVGVQDAMHVVERGLNARQGGCPRLRCRCRCCRLKVRRVVCVWLAPCCHKPAPGLHHGRYHQGVGEHLC